MPPSGSALRLGQGPGVPLLLLVLSHELLWVCPELLVAGFGAEVVRPVTNSATGIALLLRILL